jgi:UDP-N-acetylmuramate dehydrogenase
MHLDQKVSLKPLNTFGFEVSARYFVEARSRDDIHTLLNYRNMIFLPVLILGSGSNILFTGDFNGLVVHVNNKGITVVSEDDNHVVLHVQAGESWDDFVRFTGENNLQGLERLSLIPGTVGAAPVQNIGAYGSEVADNILSVSYVDIKNGHHHTISNQECQFGYRDSIFKHSLKERVIITDITFRLKKQSTAVQQSTPDIPYRELRDELTMRNIVNPSPSAIRDAVITIRQRKLPDPALLGNAGSFFKNPVVDPALLESVLSGYPETPFHREADGLKAKIPAAWLIEQCGWKGFREGDAGVHEQHALVLVNYGNADGKQILSLADRIEVSVKQKFGITLEREVRVVS